MSERYKILDSIMANPDPMIRQRLEMAYDAGRVSVLHEKKVFADDKDFDCAVTFHTAFTNRDIATLTARVAELEQENAKLLDEVKARRFTDERTDKLLDELEAENKRLREALKQISEFKAGIPCPDGRSDCAVYHTRRTDEAMIAREALDNKAE